MKKLIFLGTILFILGAARAQSYQIINGGFEEWEGSGDDREPVRWSSFKTATGSYASLVSYKQIYEETSGLRPGTTGTKCIRTQARSVLLSIIANGQFTTGRVNASSMTASSTSNCNFTDIADPNFNQPLHGKPDSVYFWAKFECPSSTQTARMSAILHSNHRVQDPEISDENQYVVARATRNFPRGSQTWMQYKVPFEYTANAVSPAFILFTFSTNSTPGTGSTSDKLYVDDVELIYNRRLNTLKVNGVPIANFNGDVTNYTYSQHVCISNASDLPVVTATTASANATHTITQPTPANPVATIVVTHGGATKTYTIHFDVDYKTAQTVQGVSCLGTPYTEHGFNVTPNNLGTQQYTRVIPNAAGCDSTITLNLMVHPTGPYIIADTVCLKAGYNKYGFSLSAEQTAAAGNFVHQLPLVSSFGCDSTLKLNLHVRSADSSTLTDRTCQNTAYTDNGFNIPVEQLQTSGLHQFVLHLTNSAGCDSTVILILTVDSIPHTQLHDNICLGGTYNKNGFAIPNNNVTGTHIHNKTFTSKQGCDSIVTLHLTTTDLIVNHITDNVCEGASYSNWGFGFPAAITGQILRDTASLTTPEGCDSVVTIAVTVNPKKETWIPDTICQRSVYNQYGFAFTAAQTAATGLYHDTLHLTTSKGCDSTIYLALFTKPIYETTLFDTVCSQSSYNKNGFAMTVNGSGNQQFANTLTAINGCDSIVTLHLKVNPVYSDTTYFTICANGTYRFYDRILDQSGIYDTTFQTVNGCDSTKVLVLTKSTQFRNNIYAEICEGNVYTENGFNFSKTGIDSAGYIASNGCDSIVILHLTVRPKHQTTLTQIACDSFLWEDTLYTGSGVYTRHYVNQFGCDSIKTLNLTIRHASSVTLLKDTVRGGFRYEKAGFLIDAPLVSQPIVDTLVQPNAAGCDSMVILQLAVLPTTITSQTLYFCENDSYQYDGQTYTTPNSFADTLYSDTATIINQTHYAAHSAPVVGFSVSSCSPYFWDGNSYDTTGHYTKIYPLLTGCDSTVTLHFTRLTPLTPQPVYDTICQGKAFANQHFNIPPDSMPVSGSYHFIRQLVDTQYICPTTAEAFIYVKPAYHFTETANACFNQGYTWRNHHYTASGTYFEQLTAASGCDSIYQLNLTIYPSYLVSTQQIVCSNAAFIWRGQSITESRVYYDSLQTGHGCDSVFMLTATVVNSFYSVLDTSICANKSLNWQDTTYQTSGVYYRHYPSASGCDSIYRLNLTILPIETVDYHKAICEGDSIMWGKIIAKISGDYSYTDTTGNCPVIKLLHLTVHSKSYTNLDAGALPGDVINFEGFIIPSDSTNTPGDLTFTRILTNQYGCDSIITLHLFVNAIAEPDLTHIRLFPNPASDMITIINEDNSPIESIAVYDIAGRLVEARTYSNSQLSIPVTHWTKGFYTIKIKTKEAIVLRKVIIQ
ncbi:MAG: T9SS type A sorting domain-containing protein [Bacteroidales bacterium]|jgi:hypothetical protein|nr:T9SS type A sorting domain-containing protein [Bacteroidales bacterium]